MPRFRQSSSTFDEYYNEQHRFEHWYRDNSVYFITARCRNRFPAFESESAKTVFWDRFDHYVAKYNFVPWVTSLIDNHYHTLGYLKIGSDLGPMMQRIHGSVVKLVNDLLPERLLPFWVDAGKQGYFDGCIRNEKQCRRTYKYVLTQSVRHGIVKDWRLYPHTHVSIELERGLRRALQLNAFLPMIPYKRYGERDTREQR